MSNKAKGDRRERQARELLEEDNFVVESPNNTPYPQSYGVDYFGLFDFMAFKSNKKPLFGQVKSNGARGIRSFNEKCVEMNVPFDYVDVEFWVCHDNEGWRIFTISADGYEKVVDERDSDCDMGEEVVTYLQS